MCGLKRGFHKGAILLSLFLGAFGIPVPSCAEAPTPEQLVREAKYVEAIRLLDEAWRAAGRLSPAEMQLYLDAYYQYGKQLLEKEDLNNARACFLRVVQLDPRHADGNFQLGIVEKRTKDYEKALHHLRSAISLGSQHSPEANVAIIGLGKECLSAAEQAIAEGRSQDARWYLTFVSSNFTGEERNKALELASYKLIPLERAAGEYARAVRLVNTRARPEAVKILRGIPEAYPGTFFAKKANELLEQLGEMIIVVRTSTGLQLPPAWRRKETTYFDAYYEKEIFFNRIVPRAEALVPQIFASLGYAKPNWKKRCKIYLFSSQSDWRKFLDANRGAHLHWMEAFSISKAMEIYLYESGDTSYMLEHILPHELTHVVHFSVVGDVSHTPYWFQEGLAQCHEKDKRKEARRTLRSLRRTNVYIPLEELVSMQGYPADAAKIGMFYLESLALMDLLLEEFGPTGVGKMAFAYKERAVPFDEVVITVLGTTMADFEKLWKRYVE